MKSELNSNKIHYPFGREWFTTERTGRVLGIREPHHFEDVLSFFIQGDHRSLLIDTGMGLSSIREFILGNDDTTVLLTHTHWDHIGGVSEFEKVAVFNHPFETERLKKGCREEEIEGTGQFSIKGVEQFSVVNDGDTIDIGGDFLHVIHTPGHTPGSAWFFMEKTGFLFTGDSLYPGSEYLHLPESDYNLYVTSLNRLQKK